MLTRLPAVALIAAACAATALATAPTVHAASSRLTSTERTVIRLMNRVRAQHGLRALHRSRRLARAADGHSRDMLRHDFFAHESSDGTSFDRRVHAYARARRVGENLAMLPGVSGAAYEVVQMWLGSAAHREILLSRGFRRVGVGTRSGQLGASTATVYTVDFASRR
jgi:uncharacterized protein YkwD